MSVPWQLLGINTELNTRDLGTLHDDWDYMYCTHGKATDPTFRTCHLRSACDRRPRLRAIIRWGSATRDLWAACSSGASTAMI